MSRLFMTRISFIVCFWGAVLQAQEIGPVPEKVANPSCNEVDGTTHLTNFQSCIQSVKMIDEKMPLDCKQLSATVMCFENYILNTAECSFRDGDVTNQWNKTADLLDKITEELCNPNEPVLHDLYSQNGAECLRDSVQQCGSSLMSTLLIETSKVMLTQEFLKQNESSCINDTQVNSCIIQNMQRIEESKCSPAVKNATKYISDLFREKGGCRSNAGGRGVESSISSTIVWILAISVTSLVVLTPS